MPRPAATEAVVRERLDRLWVAVCVLLWDMEGVVRWYVVVFDEEG